MDIHVCIYLYIVFSVYILKCNCIISFIILQLGGVIGDIEGMPYIEAMRQFQFKVGSNNFCCCHVSLIPEVRSILSIVDMQQ